MEKSDLREFESRCIQEETPQCVAACPLHVDAKSFCSLMAQRRVDKAWQVLAKVMPLPGVLARLCDAPCQAACVRKDAGGAIEMGSLERFCADKAKPVAPPRPLPSRKKSVAVVGGGLTGLCATWEMARRGFDVTLHCGTPGEGLSLFEEAGLPDGVFDAEIENLGKLKANIRTEAVLDESLVSSLLESNDAVFLDSDVLVEGTLTDTPDDLTLGTTTPGLFASVPGQVSPILQAAHGRRAANSIERFTQGVSMVTNRELEGPYETRLFTSLEKVDHQPPIDLSGDMGEVEVSQEAKRCLQCECMECVRGCEYLRHFKFYPKVYARQIYNNESIVMGTRQANTMINSCMLCGLCETICPEDFSMTDLCLSARKTLVEQGHMPSSAHEFALRDMAFAKGEKASLARHAPGTEQSEYLYYPGCQLTASNPGGVEAAYADLRARLGKVGILLDCCGAPAEWAGRVPLMNELMEGLRQTWESMGSPKIIAACPTCILTLKKGLPEAEIISHWSVLRAIGLPPNSVDGGSLLALNDPCAVRHDPVMREDVRSLLEGIGIAFEEPEYTGETTQCCGYGGLLSEANPELGLAVAKKRGESMTEDVVTYCAMCRDMISKGGKRALHMYDLLYPREGFNAGRTTPGYSERRENRARLKERLLDGLWGDVTGLKPETYEAVEVTFSQTAQKNMEDRRILISDVQKVLQQYQKAGKAFVHGETGHLLASFRPVVVTYWVEFEQKGEEFFVHNSWCHRMRIKGGQP